MLLIQKSIYHNPRNDKRQKNKYGGGNSRSFNKSRSSKRLTPANKKFLLSLGLRLKSVGRRH